MDREDDIDAEPEAASTPLADKPPTRRRGPKGHEAKLEEADRELSALGQLPPGLRPCHRNQRIQNYLSAKGYDDDMPGRNAIQEFYNKRKRRTG